MLFGDGAGAVVVEANEDDADASALLEVRLHAEGKHAEKLWTEAPGSGFTPARITHEMIDQKRHFPRMEGRFVFKHAVTRMPEVLLETLHAASLKLEDVDLFLFHQANLRINEYVAQALEIPAQKCLQQHRPLRQLLGRFAADAARRGRARRAARTGPARLAHDVWLGLFVVERRDSLVRYAASRRDRLATRSLKTSLFQ